MGRLVEDLSPAEKPDIEFQPRRIAELTEKALGYIHETLRPRANLTTQR